MSARGRTNAEGLTLREQHYANYVVQGGLSKSACAKKAGYKVGMVYVLDHREVVQAAIERRMRAAARRADVSREEIEEFHLNLLRGEPRLTRRGTVQQPTLKLSQDSAKELAAMNGYRTAAEAVDGMRVKIDMGFRDEIQEIMAGPGTRAEKKDALFRLVTAKGLT